MAISSRRSAFTLIELLVVLVIIGVLMSLLLPAIQRIREQTRIITSANNLRQMALANATFESQKGHFAPSWRSTDPIAGESDINGWSIHALLLPYLEQKTLQSTIDFNQSYKLANDVTLADGETVKLSSLRVPTYISPGEPNDQVRMSDGVPEHYPLNYAVNLGTWFIFDPATGDGGNGAAYPDSRLTVGSFSDGLTQTIAFAEVKAWQPYYRNAALDDPGVPTVAGICSWGGTFKTNSGHTEWVDGRAHQIGFTSVFSPNEKVLCTVNGTVYDVDWTNWQEGKGIRSATPDMTKTYAAVTARSYFGGGVNVARMDGSTKWISDDIDLGVWRAFTSRAGQELIPSDDQ